MVRFARKGFSLIPSFWCLALCVAVAWMIPAHADFDDAPAGGESTPVAPTPAPAAASPAPGSAAGQESSSTPLRPSTSTGSGKGASQAKPAGKPSAPAPAQGSAARNDGSGIDHNTGAPVQYSAQSLEGSLTEGRVLLKGDVEIEQADAVMKSEIAEIFSAKGSTTPNRAVAKGRVSLFKSATAQSAELRAVANELEYFMPARKVVLKGKPKIWRGRELLQGEVIEVFLETNEIKVRGARGVMDPSTGPSPVGNSGGSGVQTSPTKKSSGQNRR